MFLRCKIRKKDGNQHRYWSVVENQRVGGGRVVQRHVLYLGEINDTQELAWRRPIAVLGKRRWFRVPEVPTIEEAGVPVWPVRSWHTVVVPGGTPAEIIKSLNAMINEFLMMPDVTEKLRNFGLEPAALSVAEVADRIKADIAAFGKIMDAAGMKRS